MWHISYSVGQREAWIMTLCRTAGLLGIRVGSYGELENCGVEVTERECKQLLLRNISVPTGTVSTDIMSAQLSERGKRRKHVDTACVVCRLIEL